MTDVTRPDGLMCNHCGGEAIQFKPPAHSADFWHLGDGDGEKCDDCGFPGSVSVDDGEEPIAYWLVNDWDEGLKCDNASCEECQPPKPVEATAPDGAQPKELQPK